MSEHDFGRKLRVLRHERAETLEDVSAATGLSVAMLSRVERGERLPSPDSVEALAHHFGLPAEELMSETIASKMMNSYGREWSNRAAERMQSDEAGWGAGNAENPSRAVADSANRGAEGPRGEFAQSRTAGFADMRIGAEDDLPTEVADRRTAHSGSLAPTPSASAPAPRAAGPARPPATRAGMAFSPQPIEALFDEHVVRNSLADAVHVAEVALESALRAVRRAQASEDPAQVAEAERVLERLRRALG